LTTPAPPLFVIFGGTGDLTRRKLLPALYRLAEQDAVPAMRVLAVARDPELTDQGFRAWAREALGEAGPGGDPGVWCDRCLHYQAAPSEVAYGPVAERIRALEEEGGLSGDRVLYLALPPAAFPSVVRGLGSVGLARGPGWTRLVIEKPFGRDLASARELNQLVHQCFDERQIYRIDHYLGKETVQNLLVFRFANVVFESLWGRERVDNVQITVAEELGVGDRGSYYDGTGALRDMVQNHLTQLLALTAMEVPVAYEADAVRFEKVKVLRAVPRLRIEDVVRGQYRGGQTGGQAVPGYLEEEGVPAGSATETFVALKLAVDTWRWQGVPFYLRTGKRLPRRLTQIAVTFKKPPVALFESLDFRQVESNVLLITLQPDEGFALYIDVKAPGEPATLRKMPLVFRYGEAFGPLPDAYETLLLDVLTGDQTLFVHAEEVEAAWRLYAPLLERKLPVHPYDAGTWGPAEADALLAREGHWWRAR
jgi:glucose-6-phosphate 1-dehydrogenase